MTSRPDGPAQRYAGQVRNWIRSWVDKIAESLFLVPSLVVLGFALAAWLLVVVDNGTGLPEGFPVLQTTVASARAILSTVAGATITVAAIVFSTTALTVQLASSQYSLRIVGVLFRDTFQQVVIGVVTGTFVYSLLVLASVRLPDDGGLGAASSAATTMAIVMAIVAMLAIIGFISHVLQRIRIDTLVRRIADSTTEEVRRLLPSQAKSSFDSSMSGDDLADIGAMAVRSKKSGWLVGIDDGALLSSLVQGGVLRVDAEVGEFVQVGSVIATLWSHDADDKSRLDRITAAFTLARSRRIEGDPGFGLRLMADVALRALSSGVNDPATAVDVISQFGHPLGEILQRDLPQRVFGDDEGRRVFRPLRPDRGDYVQVALSEIRLTASEHPVVIGAFIDLAGHLVSLLEANQSARADSLRDEVRLLLDAAADSLPGEDLKPLTKKAERLELVAPRGSQPSTG